MFLALRLLCVFTCLRFITMARPMRRKVLRRPRKGKRSKPQTRLEVASSIALPRIALGTSSFTRTTAPVLLTKTASDPTANLTFAFADMPGYTDFTTLYDYYRITRIDFRIFAVFNAVVTTKLFVTSDYDGGPVPSLAEMCQHRHVERILSPDHPEFVFTFRPRTSTAVNASTGSVLSGIGKGWLDLASPTVVQYGAAYAMLNYNTGIGGVNIYTHAVYHFQCSGLR